MLCYPVKVEAFATGWSLVQRSPTVCLCVCDHRNPEKGVQRSVLDYKRLWMKWLSCVGRGLCDGLITRPEESYRVSVCVWSQKPRKGVQRSILDYKRLWMKWLSCVGRGLCDGLITRPEESYRGSVCVWLRNPEKEAKGPSWTISACEMNRVCLLVCAKAKCVSLHEIWGSHGSKDNGDVLGSSTM
jgi:hypothetical protein